MAHERAREEAILREAVLRGDAIAWRALYDRSFRPVYGFVLRRLGGDIAWTEEIVQEAWLIAVKRIDRFDPWRSAFGTWLASIALNVVRNERRRSQRAETAMEGLRVDADRDAAPSDVARLALSEQIAMALGGLPGIYQTVLRAKYELHQSVEEIAAMLERSPKAVESLLARARDAFRAAYGEDEVPIIEDGQ